VSRASLDDKVLEPDLAGLEASLRANSLFATTPGSSLAGVRERFSPRSCVSADRASSSSW
jgi:hypothetical protein